MQIAAQKTIKITKKYSLQYWNNRNWLISKMKQNSPTFANGRGRPVLSSLTKFYCLIIHTIISLQIRGFSSHFLYTLKNSALSICVPNGSVRTLKITKNSPLDIQKIEICWWPKWSKIDLLLQRVCKAIFKLVNQFLLFNYSYHYFSSTKIIFLTLSLPR